MKEPEEGRSAGRNLEIERAVERLSPGELKAFREWFVERDWEAWDRQVEADIAAGKLDSLAAEALEDARNGHCTEA